MPHADIELRLATLCRLARRRKHRVGRAAAEEKLNRGEWPFRRLELVGVELQIRSGARRIHARARQIEPQHRIGIARILRHGAREIGRRGAVVRRIEIRVAAGLVPLDVVGLEPDRLGMVGDRPIVMS